MSFNSLKSSSGFTLIELIITIILLGFALLSLVQFYSNLAIRSVDGEFRLTATLAGQEILEEIKSKRFDENTGKDANDNWSETLTVDAGETATDKTTFDDVDDFNGWNENMSGPFNGFNRSVEVDYVNAAALNTALTIPSPVPAAWTPDLKRVRVVVTNNGVQFAELVTIVGSGSA